MTLARLPNELSTNPALWFDASREPNPPASGSGDQEPTCFNSMYNDIAVEQTTNSNQPIWRDGHWAFDGVSDFWQGTNAKSRFDFMHQAGIFTLALSIKPDVDGGDRVGQLFVTNRNGGVHPGIWLVRESRDGTGVNNAIRYVVDDGNGNRISFTSSSDILATDQVHHIVLAGDGSDLYLYVDGIRLDKRVWNASSSAKADVRVAIGNQPVNNTRNYSGEFYECMVFDEFLGESAIHNLMDYLSNKWGSG